MYDPAVQRAVLEKLARWRQLPEGDLISMLSPVERLRYRPDGPRVRAGFFTKQTQCLSVAPASTAGFPVGVRGPAERRARAGWKARNRWRSAAYR